MKKLYMIGNAHLDPVWLWPWQEGFQENKATCRSALDRLREFDTIAFTSSSAQFYEWMEQNDPAMFEEIAQRIKEGRWVLCGGWWIQPDCNIPCGESFARHGLISQNYFMEKFGVMAKTGYNVDSFGHHGMIPQILKLSGMEHYVYMRPHPQEKELPARNYIWESADGSRVYAFRLPFTYNSLFGTLEDHMKACREEFDAGVDQLMCFYGVGNHGGGPTIQNIRTIQRLQKEWKDVESIFSDPDTYFDLLKKHHPNLPVVRGDLQHVASGCYSAHSQVKLLNRQAENALLRAEKFSVLSEVLTGISCPSNFTEGWKRVLFNQFHDILAGSSIECAYEDARNEYGEALSIAARNENNGLQAISFQVRIPQEAHMLPVVVFNPHSWPVTEPVEIETGFFPNGCPGETYVVQDAKGRTIPTQTVTPRAMALERTRIVFPAKVPALGYATYRIYGAENSSPPGKETSADILILENSRLKVVFDRETGGIASLQDKESRREFCREIFGKAAVMTDTSDTWSHDVFEFHDLEGYFTPVSIRKTEEGDVRSSVRITSRYNRSTLTQVYTLYREEAMLRVSATINWQEHFRCVKLQFPVLLAQYRGTYEIPFGTMERECNGLEEPMQRWMDLTGTQQDRPDLLGLSILNNGKYGASMNGNLMELTILRSPVYAHHAPQPLTAPEEEYSFIDQGIQKFEYVILPHMGGWQDCGLIKRAEELNQPCTAVIETYHEGSFPETAEFIRIDQGNIVMTALKKAHDGNGYVARFRETDGIRTEAEISMELFGQKISASFRPYEIKSYRFCPNCEHPVEVDFLERGCM